MFGHEICQVIVHVHVHVEEGEEGQYYMYAKTTGQMLQKASCAWIT